MDGARTQTSCSTPPPCWGCSWRVLNHRLADWFFCFSRSASVRFVSARRRAAPPPPPRRFKSIPSPPSLRTTPYSSPTLENPPTVDTQAVIPATPERPPDIPCAGGRESLRFPRLAPPPPLQPPSLRLALAVCGGTARNPCWTRGASECTRGFIGIIVDRGRPASRRDDDDDEEEEDEEGGWRNPYPLSLSLCLIALLFQGSRHRRAPASCMGRAPRRALHRIRALRERDSEAGQGDDEDLGLSSVGGEKEGEAGPAARCSPLPPSTNQTHQHSSLCVLALPKSDPKPPPNKQLK